ncbi:MAG: hypothetical protein ACRDGK_05010 [Actinomycetota bacterium]
MRRPTFIMIVVLFVLIVSAAVAQLVIASGDADRPLPGPASPGQLPSASPTTSASTSAPASA